MVKHTIIIPVFNAEKFLRRCLDSVLAQTRNDWECICVDDGSTDASGEICDEYARKDKRFSVIHQKNAGAGAARNAGLDVAIGEWISFVDSDDWISMDYLETFDAIKDKADVTYFAYERRGENGETSDLFKYPQSLPKGKICGKEQVERFVCTLTWNETGWNSCGLTCNKFFRRSLIEQNKTRFVESLSNFEDEIFTFRVLQCVESVEFLRKSLYFYRRTSSGQCQTGVPDWHLLCEEFISAISGFTTPSLLALEYGRAFLFLDFVFKLNGRQEDFERLILFYKENREKIRISGLGYGNLIRLACMLPSWCRSVMRKMILRIYSKRFAYIKLPSAIACGRQNMRYVPSNLSLLTQWQHS